MAIDGGIYGFEKLPNIYINNIELHEKKSGSDSEGLMVKVEFLLYDTLNEFGEDILTDKFSLDSINLNTLLCLDAELSNDIIEGKNILHKPTSFRLKSLQNKKLCFVDTKESIKVFNLNPKHCVYNEYTEFYYTKTFHLQEIPNHLSIFCLLSQQNYRREMMFGPTTSETIIENGKTVLSTKYILNDNKLWTGPVHEHDGTIMAHSFHSNRLAHPVLSVANYHNLKIKDFRRPKINLPFVKKENKQLNSKTIFSNLFHNQKTDGDLGMLFSINTKSILVQNSKEAKILQDTNPEVFNSLAQNLKIKKIEIKVKHHVKKPYTSIFYSYDENEKIKSISNEFGEMKEIVLSQSPFIRTFDISCDARVVKEVQVIVEVNNPFTNYLKNIYINFSENIKNLKTTLSYFKKEIFYDRETGKLDRERIVSIFEGDGSPWVSCIAQMLKIKNLFFSDEDDEKVNELIIKSMAKVSAKSLTIESVESFIEDCLYYLNFFKKVFEVKEGSVSSSFGKGKGAGSKIYKDELIASKKYNIHYKYKGKTKSYFQNSQDRGINFFTVNSFMQVLKDEKVKLANTHSEEIINLNNYNEYATLSPRVLTSGKEKFVYNDINTIEEESIAVFVDSLQISEEELSNIFGNNIKVEFLEEEKDLNFENLNLGTDNNFSSEAVTVDESLAPNRTKEIKKNISLVGNKNSKKTKNILDKVSSKTNSSIYSSNQEDEFNESSKVPIHHVFLANTIVSNKVFGSTEAFLRDKRYTRDLTFFNLERVYYEEFDFFDDSGEPLVGLTKIKPLTMDVLANLEQPILCTLNLYHDPNFNVDNNQFEKFETIDKNFIIYPNNYSLTKDEISIVIGEDIEEFRELYEAYLSLDVQEIQFSRTNIVKEDEGRNDRFYEKGLGVRIRRFNDMEKNRIRYFNKLNQERRKLIIMEEQRQRDLEAEKRKRSEEAKRKAEELKQNKIAMLNKMAQHQKVDVKNLDLSLIDSPKPPRKFPEISSGIVTNKLDKAITQPQQIIMEDENVNIPDKILPVSSPTNNFSGQTQRPSNTTGTVSGQTQTSPTSPAGGSNLTNRGGGY